MSIVAVLKYLQLRKHHNTSDGRAGTNNHSPVVPATKKEKRTGRERRTGKGEEKEGKGDE